MSDLLDKARSQATDGKYKAAVRTLVYARSESDLAVLSGDLGPIRALREIAVEARNHVSGSVLRDCETEISHADSMLREVHESSLGLFDEALVYLHGCRVIGGAGLPVEPAADRDWSLSFTEDRVALLPSNHPKPEEIYEIGWDGLHIEIDGAGQITKGGRFIGGGFGLVGAAAGMLTASALNALTTRTGIDTVIHLQTPSVELYLYYGREIPAALRRTLSPVFLKLRQAGPAGGLQQDNADDGHVVDRLHKLADLRERGMISEEEFARLKADLMSELP